MAKTIKIGHASTSGGALANNVLVQADYNVVDQLEYNIVLRPKSLEIASKSAAACEAGCNNNKIGYSQSSRMTLYNYAKNVGFDLAKVNNTCYTDCSAFMSVCAIAAGAKLGGGQTCGTMKDAFTASGSYSVLTDKKYLTSTDYLQRGDILVRDWYKNGSRHTVMVLENGGGVPAVSFAEDLYKDFFAINVGINIKELTPTRLLAVAKITKIEDNTEKDLTRAVFSAYDWKYLLNPLTKTITSTKHSPLPIEYGNTKFTLQLTPNTSYILSLRAIEKASGATFNSPSIIFTTPASQVKYETGSTVVFEDNTATNKKCKIFVKIKDSFKRAVVYHK